MLSVNNLSKTFGQNKILDGVSFVINDGDKVAIMGLNGAGKSTLLRLILGQIPFDSGAVEITGGRRIGFMPQTIDEMDLPDDIIVYDFLSSGRPVIELEKQIADLYQQMANGDLSDELSNQLETIQNEFDFWGGYSAASELERMISEMGISADTLKKPLGQLSGGQKSKISFIRALYSRPDILFLDEPTNHLDAGSRDWMIDYLKNSPSTVIFISHDEDFVRSLAKKILQIDATSRKATLYGFGYDRFLKTLSETNVAMEKQMRNQMAKVDKMQAFIDTTAGKSGKMKRATQSREKLLDKFKQTIVPPVQVRSAIRLDLRPNKPCDDNPVVAENISFSYDGKKNIITDLSFALGANERFIIIGENGAGKSTVLKLIANALSPNSGEIRFGRRTDVGYYAQEFENIEDETTVLQNMQSGNEHLPMTRVRSLLGRFNFNAGKIGQAVRTLSPGERSRLELAKICLSGGNLLLLDEPTNHLDTPTKKAMADALRDYGGTLLIVSHDIEFLENLEVGRMLMLPSGRVRFYDAAIVKKYMDLEK